MVGSLFDLIGLKLMAVKGHKARKNTKYIYPEVLLFDDKESFVYLEDQDYYSYHDCSTSAKELEVRKDKTNWEFYMNDPSYGDANVRD